MGWEKLLDILPGLERWWKRFRYPARVEINAEWRSDMVNPLYGPISYHREMTLTVVAGKVDEFVVAGGEIQARASSPDSWTAVADVGNHTHKLPHTVNSNRSWSMRVDGESLARDIEQILDRTENSMEVRAPLHDHHGTTLESPRVETSLEELKERKKESI